MYFSYSPGKYFGAKLPHLEGLFHLEVAPPIGEESALVTELPVGWDLQQAFLVFVLHRSAPHIPSPPESGLTLAPDPHLFPHKGKMAIY